MLTYQDLVNVGEDEKKRKAFVRACISAHMRSEIYTTAKDAYEYVCHRNVTMRDYQKLLYTVTGKAIPDNFSANFKMSCRHFHRFITQETQYLLGNGVSWNNEATEKKLGTAKYPFDGQLQKLGKKSLWGGVAFGFYNLDHIDVFSILEFVPLYDEDDGTLKAGIRFWQLDKNKPLMATLYELEGYTEYKWEDADGEEELKKRQPYKTTTRFTDEGGEETVVGENYGSFPIVPLWGNPEHQSEIVGLREQIDCYDLIKSGFANTVDEASYVYWTINNAGGMKDMDLARFVERMKTLHAATVDEFGATAQSHSQEAPYASREALLNRLDKDLYRDAMALDIERIASGAVTATQIKAAYEPLNSKCDEFEYCVIDFIQGILTLAGIEDEPSFTRSMIVNAQEEISVVLQAAQYLTEDYVTEKILTLLGDADKVEDMQTEKDANAFAGIDLDVNE